MDNVDENANQTYDQVLESTRNILRPKYKQKPQLSATNPVVSVLFPSLEGIPTFSIGFGNEVCSLVSPEMIAWVARH
ncbi:hypothetical protein M378DRAFT_168456 [Amanita muscaria Koide BX008]|uniref:Uncharacterized protein n=1 Tax=Amanita muscaria (strain Koide BX008) TaxID=946122 RepID=A0A0C2WV11_AMAMK|nr:hypothetical protein M378DRAFT_168456 [Amanita muscaria Koide BX008]